ncbi:pyridoxine-5 -phosphate oxidase-like [Brachionus plicatilis]|uniref:pyridoxal 5'-phosphate synthase n=1 Tax=Brachionus plicatilis TaxID=10195 RepID=A0A3M7SUQ7_BRAPC|nr:pyridoxine-5 -phosphate oxidase-like [Brachionus plicatilis]
MPGTSKLDISTLESRDPFKQFNCWFLEAKQNKNIKNPNAACLATCGLDGHPSCRMIQVGDFSDKGFLFFTNYDSKKAKELSQNKQCSLCFYWDHLDRQIVLKGRAEKIKEHESMDYFSRCPVAQQIKSLSSVQGKIIKDKQELVDRQQRLAKEFETTKKMPVPETYCGYLFIPDEFDFWQGNQDDIDDRLRFRKKHEHEDQELVTPGEGFWVIERLGA